MKAASTASGSAAAAPCGTRSTSDGRPPEGVGTSLEERTAGLSEGSVTAALWHGREAASVKMKKSPEGALQKRLLSIEGDYDAYRRRAIGSLCSGASRTCRRPAC